MGDPIGTISSPSFPPPAFPLGGFDSLAQAEESHRPFYGPSFLFKLRRVLAGHSSLRTDWDLGRLSVNLIEGSSSFPPRPDFFRIYILDEDNRLVSHVWLASGSVDNWLAGKRYELRADEIEFLGNPILYRTPKPLNDGIMLESMVIFRAKNIKADGKERVSLSDFEERVLAQTWPERQRIAWEIDLAYLKSRYGTEGLGDVANDYSPTAMQQAFARIHPNSEALREEFIRFTPVVPAPALAQIEETAIAWLAQIMGYPKTAGGILTSGGSLSTLSAMVAAVTPPRMCFGSMPTVV